MGKIIGYKKFTSKAGVKYCVLNVLQEFSNYEIKYGAIGQKVEEIWLQDELVNTINENCIGKQCKTTFEKIGNKFQLSEFEIIAK